MNKKILNTSLSLHLFLKVLPGIIDFSSIRAIHLNLSGPCLTPGDRNHYFKKTQDYSLQVRVRPERCGQVGGGGREGDGRGCKE